MCGRAPGFLILFPCCFPLDFLFNNLSDNLQRNLLEVCFCVEHHILLRFAYTLAGPKSYGSYLLKIYLWR